MLQILSRYRLYLLKNLAVSVYVRNRCIYEASYFSKTIFSPSNGQNRGRRKFWSPGHKRHFHINIIDICRFFKFQFLVTFLEYSK